MAYSTYFQNFVDRVAAYCARENIAFTFGTNTLDNLLLAVNDVRKMAQHAYDWNQLQTSGAIYVNGSTGADWYTPNTTYGPYVTDDTGSTKLKLKWINAVFNYTKDSAGNMQPTNRIMLDNRRWFSKLLPSNMGFPFTQVYPAFPPFYYNTLPTQQIFAYVVGSKFYVNTTSVPTWYMIFGQQVLSDLAGSETSDFFIDNYSYWLLPATLQNLNMYMKEDNRVAISDTLLKRMWETATSDDAKKGEPGDDWTSLD